MLTSPTTDKLRDLGLTGMARAFSEQLERPDYQGLSFEERIGLLVDREVQDRDNRRLARNLRTAKLRTQAGVGKTFLACALAQAALRRGHRVLYLRVPRLLEDLALARADGRLPRLMTAWTKLDVLLLDDLALRPLTPQQAADLLEVIEDRHQRRSTIVTSQLPVSHWHEALGEPTIADAILDRLVHGAFRLELRGDSYRRVRPKPAADINDGEETMPIH